MPIGFSYPIVNQRTDRQAIRWIGVWTGLDLEGVVSDIRSPLPDALASSSRCRVVTLFCFSNRARSRECTGSSGFEDCCHGSAQRS
eukprot:4903222-Amphidinium_carterae.1